jgi:hypothetical protein
LRFVLSVTYAPSFDTHDPQSLKGARDSVGVAALELLREDPVAKSEAPDVFLVTLAPLGIGVLEPDGVRFLKEERGYLLQVRILRMSNAAHPLLRKNKRNKLY